jgi:hypothetical protein
VASRRSHKWDPRNSAASGYQYSLSVSHALMRLSGYRPGTLCPRHPATAQVRLKLGPRRKRSPRSPQAVDNLRSCHIAGASESAVKHTFKAIKMLYCGGLARILKPRLWGRPPDGRAVGAEHQAARAFGTISGGRSSATCCPPPALRVSIAPMIYALVMKE